SATIEAREPRRYGPYGGALGAAAAPLSVTFVCQAAVASGIGESLGSRRRFVAVHGCRDVRRDRLAANRACPPVDVDPGDGAVRLAGPGPGPRPPAPPPPHPPDLPGVPRV